MSVEHRGTKALELWTRRATEGYPGVNVSNMTTSWRNGLAFCALIHHFRPELVDFKSLKSENILENNALAFRVAEQHLGIPALLDAEDMVQTEIPDRLSILTYVSQFYQAFSALGLIGPGGRRSPLSNNNNKNTSVATPTTPSKPAAPIVASPRAKSISQPPSTLQTKTETGFKTDKVTVGARGRREECVACHKTVFLAERIVVGFPGQLRHRTCFRCDRCSTQLTLASYYETEKGQFCCETCPDEERAVSSGEEDEVAGSETRLSRPGEGRGGDFSSDSESDSESSASSDLEENSPPKIYPEAKERSSITSQPPAPRTIFLQNTLESDTPPAKPPRSDTQFTPHTNFSRLSSALCGSDPLSPTENFNPDSSGPIRCDDAKGQEICPPGNALDTGQKVKEVSSASVHSRLKIFEKGSSHKILSKTENNRELGQLKVKETLKSENRLTQLKKMFEVSTTEVQKKPPVEIESSSGTVDANKSEFTNTHKEDKTETLIENEKPLDTKNQYSPVDPTGNENHVEFNVSGKVSDSGSNKQIVNDSEISLTRENLNDSGIESLARENVNDSKIESLGKENVNNSEIESLGKENVNNSEIESLGKENVNNSEIESLGKENVNNSEIESLGKENVNNSEIESLGKENVNNSEIESLGKENVNNSEIESLGKENVNNSEIESLGKENVNNSEMESVARENVNNSERESVARENVNNSDSESLGNESMNNFDKENLGKESIISNSDIKIVQIISDEENYVTNAPSLVRESDTTPELDLVKSSLETSKTEEIVPEETNPPFDNIPKNVDNTLDTEKFSSEIPFEESLKNDDNKNVKYLLVNDSEEKIRKEDEIKEGEEEEGSSKFNYPDELNPFGSDEEPTVAAANLQNEPPVPVAVKSENSNFRQGSKAEDSRKVIKAPLNPFDTDDEEEKLPKELKKEPPKKRKKSLNPFWSDNDESDNSSSASSPSKAKVKPPRPPPPTLKRDAIPVTKKLILATNYCDPPSPSPSARSSSSDQSTLRLKKKLRQAPAPPSAGSSPLRVKGNRFKGDSSLQESAMGHHGLAGEGEYKDDVLTTKMQKDLKNHTNKMMLKSGISTPKSEVGEWRRKKGPAPSRPVPQKRVIRKLPMRQVQQELQDIEIKQTELERQGVLIETAIREKTEPVSTTSEESNSVQSLSTNSEAEKSCSSIASNSSSYQGVEVEDMILHLFELVNEKNDLFRRQTELMYLKREKRLEEEYAELEYQIRCLMLKSPSERDEDDVRQEEELIRRLVKVVEQRDAVVNCLEMERQREAIEDESIATHMIKYQEKHIEGIDSDDGKDLAKKKKKKLRLLKKKKKGKEKEKSSKIDADKDVDETEIKKKKKKNWFKKPIYSERAS